MSLKFHFVLGSHDFTVQASLDFANKIGKTISDEAFKKGKYIVQSNVSDENFQSFLSILNDDDKIPEIDEKNYYDYYILSREFNNILKSYVLKSEYEEIRNISFIKKAISKTTVEKSYCEEYISEHLDYFLEHYKEEMAKIQYAILYNIFQHKNRILNNQERAYQFIKYVLSKSEEDGEIDKRNICILLETLDGKNLTEESFKEAFSKRRERFGFAPKEDFSFMSSFSEKVADLKTQIENKIDSSLNELIRQQKETNDDVKQQQLLLMNIINEQNKLIIEMKKQQLQLIDENQKQKQAIIDMKSYFDQKIILIQSNCESAYKKSDETQKEMKCMSQSFKSIEGKIASICQQQQNDATQSTTQNEDIKSRINSLAGKVSELKRISDQMSPKCSDSYSCVQHLPEKINSIENHIKQLFDKVCDNLSISLASIGSFKGIIRQLTDECGGNVNDKNIVNVTSSSQYSSYY